MDKYSTLSNHLKYSIDHLTHDESIDEGFLDSMKNGLGELFGKNKPSKEQEKKALGFFGAIGQMFGLVNSLSDPENKLAAKYQEIAKKEAEDAETRLRNEMKAEEDAEIAKLTAKYEHNKQQLNLKSAQRVEKYNSIKKQADECAARAKDTKLLFSAKANQAFLDTIDGLGKDLDIGEDNPLMEMEQLATAILIREDGSVRSFEDLQNDIKTDPKLKEMVDRQAELAKKYGKDAIGAMQSDAYAKLVKQQNGEVLEVTKAQDQAKSTENALNSFESSGAVVGKIKEMQKKNNDAKEALAKESDKLASLIGGKKSDGTTADANPFCKNYDVENKKLSPLEPADYKKALKEAIATCSSPEEIKTKLEELGVPGDMISSLTANESGTVDIDVIKGRIDELKEDQLKTAAEATKTKMEKAINTAQAAKTTAEENVKRNPDPTTDEGKKAIEENGTEEDKKALKDFEVVKEACANDDPPVDDPLKDPRFDPSSDEYKKLKAQLEKDRDTAASNLKKMETKAEANKKRREAATAAIEMRANASVPDDLKDDLKDALSGLEEGEYYDSDGNIVCKIDGKEVKKPGPNSTPEEQNKYKAERAYAIMQMNPDDAGDSDFDNVGKITKNADGTYTIYDKDGKVLDDKASKEDAVYAKASQASRASSKQLIIKRKQDAAANLEKVFAKGEFDEKAFNSLSKEDQEVLKKIMTGDKPINEYFKGIDVGDGNATAEKIAKLMGEKVGEDESAEQKKKREEIKKGMLHALTSADDNDYLNGDADDWEDADDEENDDNSEEVETDEEVEDTEKSEDTLEDGTKLKKGKDGKWYKEDDLNDDGTPKEGKEAVEHTAKKKKTLINPAKEWKQKTNKRTGKKTKSYYNKKGDSISRKDYLAKLEAYRNQQKKNTHKKKEESVIDYTSLTNWLFEKLQ